ncbi:MAG TPA: TRCF domain-containing protein, partial [Deinococcales bacterium]|nr:TRCF domain-containing protein [Deinococcales bacterium]
LGPEQHGHIQMVSLEVYTELLAEAISKLKGEIRPAAPRVTIDLPVDARIEPDYVPDEMERISIYGRLSEAASLPEITRVERELKSRHGPPPREVQNFLELARLRVTAAQRGVAAITDGVTHLSVSFHQPHLDYDARAMRRHPNHPEITQYPPGFKVPKKGLKPDEYPTLILDLLYAFE